MTTTTTTPSNTTTPGNTTKPSITTTPSSPRAELKTTAKRSSWLWLVAGALWIVVSVIILQFNQASVGTVGTIAGVMLLAGGVEYFFLPTMNRGLRWLSYLFGTLLIIGGFVALAYPGATFLALATTLGFVFMAIGVMWVVEAFLVRDTTNLWWFNLVAGIVMMIQGLWLSGQFLLTQAATLLIFAGIWAMMRGILNITAAFAR